MELPRPIPYRPKWSMIVACAVFFGACAALMAHRAMHNTAGLILNGILTLGPAGATVFYGLIAALSAGFVLMAVLLAVRRMASPPMLELGTEALRLPHGLFQQRITRIAYADIQNVSEVRVSGQTFLYLTAHGLRYMINASLLPDRQTYADLRALLASRAAP